MPTTLLALVIAISAVAVSIVGVESPRQPSGVAAVEVTVSNWGCDSIRYVVPAESPPELLVRNHADESMVFAVTDFDQMIRVQPGQQMTMPLQAYVWGTFNFVCMTESAHDAATGMPAGSQYLCGLDAFVLRRHALTDGSLIIEPHGRLLPRQQPSQGS
jgi:hypothetical protein